LIEVSGVTKAFGPKIAVDDATFTARPGGITYLLGPNGAGKTTVIRMIAGLSTPDAGAITVNGRPITGYPDFKREIGFSLSPFARNPKHTARQHLSWQARLAGIPVAEVDEMLGLVGLESVRNRPVGGFSLGMSQRLGIATALLGDPSALVLDEPANGLDVDGILWLRDLLVGLADRGKTLLICSHNLAEVEITASRIVIMGRGRVLADDTRDAVVAQGSGPRKLESAYLQITRATTEYVPGAGR